MTQRERLLTVLRGETPDCVPFYADLSHWFVVERGERFVPAATTGRDTAMVDLHREFNAGLYLNMGAFYDTVYEDGETTEEVRVDGDLFTWTISTPMGVVREERRWSPVSHSWDITRRMIRGVDDFPVIHHAMAQRRYVPRYERYHEWAQLCGDIGLPFAAAGYGGLGFLVSRFMGVIEAMYAICDYPEETAALIEAIDRAQLGLAKVLADSPSPVVFWSDNLCATTQPPPLFVRFSMDFYREMARLAHVRGKLLAVHIDGRLGGVLPLLAECGVDIADAVTPAPMGDLTPEECREQAGPAMTLLGGIPPTLWETRASEAAFEEAVKRWLDLRLISPRLVLAPGDQVPPHAPRRRIARAAELAETYGRY